MALNLGANFSQRWLATPAAVRQTLLDDLGRACDVLLPLTDTKAWIAHDQVAQQTAQMVIEQAYADLKAELIEAARLRKQLALNAKLDAKRAAQAAYAAAMFADEDAQIEQQNQELGKLQQYIQDDLQLYLARYRKNPKSNLVFGGRVRVVDQENLSALENLRLRLELEAESMILAKLTDFKAQLEHAAQEEIEYILKRHTSDSLNIAD